MDGFQANGQNLAIADQGKRTPAPPCDTTERVNLNRWHGEGTLDVPNRRDLSQVESPEMLFEVQPATLRFLLWHLCGKSDDRT
ncbi:MAG: hypothetical protein ACK57Y_01245 [Pirellulaceae bacterium]|jgi:hypothetical protein